METLIIVTPILTSITAVTFIIERGLALRIAKVIPTPVADVVMNYSNDPAGSNLILLKSVCNR